MRRFLPIVWKAVTAIAVAGWMGVLALGEEPKDASGTRGSEPAAAGKSTVDSRQSTVEEGPTPASSLSGASRQPPAAGKSTVDSRQSTVEEGPTPASSLSGASRQPPAASRSGPESLATETPELQIERADLAVLRGADSRRQLVVTGKYPSGRTEDLTRSVTYTTAPTGVVSVDADGLVTPLGDGEVDVSALFQGTTEAAGRAAVTVRLHVEGFTQEVPVHFPNQIVPIFTKYGCNSGGCHGKSGGQNGFALSLLGFYPDDDHEYLVHEGRGRRVVPAAPAQSLLLLKATNSVPHGGGERVKVDSYEYRLLYRWMQQGMPYGQPSDPTVARIEVHPSARTLGREASQQLSVFAFYSDGAVEDVSPMAQYESNDTEMATVAPSGLVATRDLSGDAAIMVRYQGQVAVFRATVPLGVDVQEFPPVRNFIDELVFAKLKGLGLPPSKPCDDPTFLRRVTVDIDGRLPTADEAKAFLESADPEKRAKLIDRLLDSGDYADYFANKWSAVLRNKRVNDGYVRGNYAFHEWLRDSLYQNRPYHEMVSAIVAASGDMTQNPPAAWYRAVASTEQQVEDSAQLFLGLRIQCARCHHHPFERWSQRDYYGFSAFFSRVGKKKSHEGLGAEDRVFHNRGAAAATNPRTGEKLVPTGLGGEPLSLSPDDDPRQALAAWLSDPANPFFAPALVNRYWKHFFGRGLVEPEDDMRVTNPPSHPELLRALAEHFVKSKYDLKALVRTLCQSSVYQLASAPNPYNVKDKQNYSRFYPRRLQAEVLYDAIHAVAGVTPSFGGVPAGVRAVSLPDTGSSNYFLTVFGKPMADSACECERSNEANLAQSLHLLNSGDILGKVSADGGRAARLGAGLKGDGKAEVEDLYYWAFSRPPDAEELQIALGHLAKTENKRHAFEDITWALVNTKEFLFTH